MAEHHDYQALEWVKGEIDETLKQAQQSLEAFVDNPDDSTRMRFCLTHLHQVYGTLQMVEFYGAALVAEEMEKLAQALLNQTAPHVADAQEVLMRAILQLPVYLDGIKTARRDMPVVVLPLLNDLRAARGESLLSETALFKPDLAAGSAAAPSRSAAASFEIVMSLSPIEFSDGLGAACYARVPKMLRACDKQKPRRLGRRRGFADLATKRWITTFQSSPAPA